VPTSTSFAPAWRMISGIGMRPRSRSAPRATPRLRAVRPQRSTSTARRRVVVTTVAGFGAGPIRKAALRRPSRVRRAAGCKIKFQIDWRTHGVYDGADGFLRQDRTTQIGMQYGAVRLNTERMRSRADTSRFASRAAATVPSFNAAESKLPANAERRRSSRWVRRAAVTCVRPWRASRLSNAGPFSRRSREGMSAALACRVSTDQTSVGCQSSGLPLARR